MVDLFKDVENKTLHDLVKRLSKEPISSFTKKESDFTVNLKEFEVTVREYPNYNNWRYCYEIRVSAQDHYLGRYNGQVAEKLYKSLDSRIKRSERSREQKLKKKFRDLINSQSVK